MNMSFEFQPAATHKEKRCKFLRGIIHDTAVTTFCDKKRNRDWLEDNFLAIELVTKVKMEVISFRKDSSAINQTLLRIVRNITRKTARHIANQYMMALRHRNEISADNGNIYVVLDGMKKALGTNLTKTSPLMSSTCEIMRNRG